MKDYLVKTADVFNIEMRLKEIDQGYEVFYNKLKKRFEVHNINNKDGETLTLVCPYSELDCRVVSLIRKTRVERSRDIIREIEEHNEKLERKQEQEFLEKQKEKMEILKRKLG